VALNQIIRAFGDSKVAGAPYVFQEYPKHVVVKGRTIVCRDEDEEAAALADQDILSEPDERARLIAVAQQKGLSIDGRWKIEKMRAAIVNAGYDPDFDPRK
jgi:hypothetical protein